MSSFPVPPPNLSPVKTNAFLDLKKAAVPFKAESLVSHQQIDAYAPPHHDNVDLYGGRKEALKILEKVQSGHFKKYDEERNDAFKNKTTMMATYLKFGCISCREAYKAAEKGNGKNDTLVSELYWREFYAQLYYHKPELLQAQIGTNPNVTHKIKMMEVKWKPATGPKWTAWCLGKTGYPFVDAGMRQMHATGFMHNRYFFLILSLYTLVERE